MPRNKKNLPRKQEETQSSRFQGHFPDRPAKTRQYDVRNAPHFTWQRPHAPIKSRLWLLILLAGIVLLAIGAGFILPAAFTRVNRQKAESALQTLYYQPTEQAAQAVPLPSPKIRAAATTEALAAASLPLRSFATSAPWKVNVTGDRFLSLRKINKDVVGWLTIDGFLDLPVVQRDNSYYLTHDFYKKASSAGTLFLDENYGIVPPSENLLIHGHNMCDGAMFGRLSKYAGKAFYADNWMIKFETLYEAGNYVVFAVFSMENDPADPAYLRYAYNHFDTDAQFTQFIAAARQRSVINSGLDVMPSDRLLTLSTCVRENSYFVVLCRRVRDDETLSGVEFKNFSSINR